MTEQSLTGEGITPRTGEGQVVWYRSETALSNEDDIETIAPADRPAEHDRFETARE